MAVFAQEDIRFAMAGLQVELRTSRPGDLTQLAGHYRDYETAAQPPHDSVEPHLTVKFETDTELVGPEPRANHPRFDTELIGGRTIRLKRFDAIGDVSLPSDSKSEQVAVTFRSGGNRHSLEAAVRIGVSIALPRIGGLILHASAVATEHGAKLFLGESGAGKSTISTMLHDAPVSCQKISDELLAIAYDATNGQWRAYVTPFIGGAGLPHGRSWPIDEIYFLRQALEHKRSERAPGLALRELLRHVLVYVAETDTADRVLGLAAQVSREIPCYELAFRKDPQVAEALGIA